MSRTLGLPINDLQAEDQNACNAIAAPPFLGVAAFFSAQEEVRFPLVEFSIVRKWMEIASNDASSHPWAEPAWNQSCDELSCGDDPFNVTDHIKSITWSMGRIAINIEGLL